MAGENPGRESGAPRVSTLLRAVQRGDYGALASLLGSYGEDHHEGTNNLGLLAALLVEACGREHLDCIELLLQRMMKPSPKRNLRRRGYFPMHTAAGAGATESIELLLSAGLSPKTRDRSGRTPLHIAAAQGSAECVSLLCAVARSTVVSRDRASGDTPAHFAVRARNGVCIEVLLSYARGGYDILRETNAKGETPLDLAAALGDTSLILRSGRATRGAGTACPEGSVDIQRIMAVWERFFENAAMACVGGRDTTSSQHGQLATGHHETTAKTLGVGGWSVEEVSASTTAWGNDARAEVTIRSRDEEKDWSEGESNTPSLAASVRDRQLPRLLPGTPVIARSRIRAWEPAATDPVGNHKGEPLDGHTRQQPPPQQPPRDELHAHLDSEEPILSSDDVDLHLFQTPTGGSDEEVFWLSESHHGEIHYTSEPPADNDNPCVPATAAGPLHRHQTWVACWDATSESIYFWDSESGELTWDTPAPTDGFHEVQSCVWDPQREAFFTVDEGGTSHWLRGSTADDTIILGTTVPLAQVADYGKANSGSAGSTTRHTWQGFGSTTGMAEDSQSTEAVGFRDNAPTTLAEKEEEKKATGRAMVQETTERKEQSLRLSPYSFVEAGYQPVAQLPDDPHRFDYPVEQSSTGISNCTRQDDARQEHEIEPLDDKTTVGEERLLTSSTATAVAINNESAGEEDRSDSVEFFDSRTCEDHCQLSAWVQWCTAPSQRDGDGQPYMYFVNEETGTSSWVLPPEALATSGGWLRAWSEEHRAWFYANQWTGRVTWELQDLETEGAINSSARVES